MCRSCVDMTSIESQAPAPTPALLTRPAHVRMMRSFDVVSVIGDSAVAWCIRDLSSGEQKRFLQARTRGEDVLGGLTRAVTDWVSERAPEGPVSLRCFAIALRDAITERLHDTRFAPADLIELNSSADWAHAVRARLREDIARYEHAEYVKRVMYAASDGSVHPTYGNGAYSWVTSEGDWHVARSHTNILASEVMAIASFVRMFRTQGAYFRAVLFVDSLNAIDAVMNGAYVHHKIHEEELANARALIRTGRLELIWVRSHQGHVLNDVADRLALQRHRAVRSDLDEHQIKVLCQQIVDGARETLQTTNWHEATREARQAYQDHMLEQAHAA
ncbi:hypothetical protein CXR34_07935 [Microbacterium hominis]|uniref:RNase H type-1 domain-containing protein n=1 Tax=Microbacterium hominis TaxID=162426 RepID=A0A2K9DXM8_9MICO|nr:hypothetical protein CXR34_07935 [Microbacterium hominis]